MSRTKSFAKAELDLLVKLAPADDRPIIEPFIPEILELCEKFGNSGQSGGSAPYVADAITYTLKKLLLQKPVSPMTGEDDEWVNVAEYGPEIIYQNKRCSALFKDEKDRAWYLDAIVWKTQTGGTWGGTAKYIDGLTVHSRQYVKSFPFIPKTFYIDVIEEEVKKGDWVFHIIDPADLERVWKYYDPYNEL